MTKILRFALSKR